MKARLAMMFWWIGVAIGALLLIAGAARAPRLLGTEVFGLCIVLGIVFTACSWAVGFVLNGSFWKPSEVDANTTYLAPLQTDFVSLK
jgi:hypothetical protein